MWFKNALLFVVMLWSPILYGQIQVAQVFQQPKKFELSTKDFEKFKASKTIFVVRDQDEEHFSLIEDILSEVWTFTDYEILTYSEILQSGQYKDTNTSFFTLGGYMRGIVKHDNTMDFKTYIYLNLWRNVVNEKGELDKQQLARAELYPSNETVGVFYNHVISYPERPIQGAYFGEAVFGKSILMDHLYQSAVLHNYNWFQIRNSLQVIDSLLTEGKSRLLVPEDYATYEVVRLKDQMLYIPDYSLIKLDLLSRTELETVDPQELLKKYPYPATIINMEKLNQLMKAGEPLYYLMFVRSNSTKMIWVVNNQSGKIVFFRSADGYQLRDFDMAALAKAIAKCCPEQ